MRILNLTSYSKSRKMTGKTYFLQGYRFYSSSCEEEITMLDQQKSLSLTKSRSVAAWSEMTIEDKQHLRGSALFGHIFICHASGLMGKVF